MPLPAVPLKLSPGDRIFSWTPEKGVGKPLIKTIIKNGNEVFADDVGGDYLCVKDERNVLFIYGKDSKKNADWYMIVDTMPC